MLNADAYETLLLGILYCVVALCPPFSKYDISVADGILPSGLDSSVYSIQDYNYDNPDEQVKKDSKQIVAVCICNMEPQTIL